MTTAFDRPLEPGTLIAHNYRVTQRLGAGGMGTVYLADNVTLAQRVVVKALRGGQAGAGQEEAQMLANLQHPNVVTVFAHDPRLDCIVMEFLDGSSLSTIVDKGIDRINAIRIAMAIADALAAVHRRGLVHRDIKPENVMLALNPGGGRLVDWLKLIDFGLALKRGKTPPVLLGTAEYCGPEQFSAQMPAHPGNDVYALGVTLFLMLTGTFPFTGTFEELPSQHANLPVPSLLATLAARADPPKLDPRTSALLEDLDELIQHMMAKDFEQRPSASEVARRLQKFESSFAEAGTFVGSVTNDGSAPEIAPVRSVRARTGVLRGATDPGRNRALATPQEPLPPLSDGSDTSSTAPDMQTVDSAPTAPRMPPLVRPVARKAPEAVTHPALTRSGKPNWLAIALAIVVLGLGLAVAFVEPPKPAPIEPPAEQPAPAAKVEPTPPAVAPPELPVAKEPEPPTPPTQVADSPPTEATVDAGVSELEDDELAALSPVKEQPRKAPKAVKTCVADAAWRDSVRTAYNDLFRQNPGVEDLEAELTAALLKSDCRRSDAVLAKMREMTKK